MKETLKRLAIKFTSFKNLLTVFEAVCLGAIIFGRMYEFKELAYALTVLLGLSGGYNILEKKILK